MPEHTPPHVRRKGAAYGRRDRLVIGTDGDEDAPTVTVDHLRELGIDPDSLATAPHLARRIREEQEMHQRHAEVRRARDASDRVLQSRDHHPWGADDDRGQEPLRRRVVETETPRERYEPLERSARPDRRADTVLVVAVALLPLIVAIGAAIWLLML